MRLIDFVEQNKTIAVSAFDQRTLASKVELAAGGPGSGRHKVEAYLREQGFVQHKVGNTKDGNDFQGNSHWSKKLITNPHGANNHSKNLNTVTHTVTVAKDGSWTHTVTGIHGGNSLGELKTVNIAASKSTSGKGVDKLKALFAGGPGSGRHRMFGKFKKTESYHKDGNNHTRYETENKATGESHRVDVKQGFGQIRVKKSSDFSYADESPRPTFTHFTSGEDASNHLASVYGIKHSFGMSANKTSKKETDTKIQAPSDLGKQKGKSPGKNGKIIASEGDCSMCHKPGMLKNGVCAKCAKVKARKG